jgi:hypothetical protein
MLFRRGLNAKQVQVWLAHHSPAFTLSTYAHLLLDDLPEIDVLPGGGDERATSPTETIRDDEPADEAETGMEAPDLFGTLRPV